MLCGLEDGERVLHIKLDAKIKSEGLPIDLKEVN